MAWYVWAMLVSLALGVIAAVGHAIYNRTFGRERETVSPWWTLGITPLAALVMFAVLVGIVYLVFRDGTH